MKGAFQRSFARQTHPERPWLRDVILGGQDGLVNVLGIVLGVSAANGTSAIIIAASLAAAFAESFSMAAVAYTSGQAERDYYQKTLGEKWSEVNSPPDFLLVGFAALFASFIPIFPFFLLGRELASLIAFVVSGLVLFFVGAYEAKSYQGSWWRHGLRMVAIGLGASAAGFFVGKIFQVK